MAGEANVGKSGKLGSDPCAACAARCFFSTK